MSAAPSAAAWWRSMPPAASRSGRRTRFRESRSEPRRVRAARSCGDRRAAACGRSPRSTPNATGSTSRRETATRTRRRRESDAIMALAMDTGRVLWIQQTLAGDAWNVGCLETGAGRVNCPEKARTRLRLLELAVDRRAAGWQARSSSPVRSPARCSDSIPTPASSCGRHRLAQGGILGGIEWGFSRRWRDGLRVALERARERSPARRAEWSR